MQEISNTQSPTLSLIPGEILSMILHFAMRCNTPVHLEHLLKYAQQRQNIRRAKKIREIAWETGQIIISEPGAFANWFVDLVPGELEHYQDWLLVNSTCRRFRVWGKKPFFMEKVFVVKPEFWENLGETTKWITAEDVAIARASIRHVIAPAEHQNSPSQFLILPKYCALQNLRTLTIQIGCSSSEIDYFSSLDLSELKQYPLPEKFASLLQDLGLPVDRLEMGLNLNGNENHHQNEINRLVNRVYPVLEMRKRLRQSAMPVSV